ncbi:hypothetical protein [Anaerococcus urinomassiliensis]|uniref:hypothetical protein n=1 Tax=Anaerococcus urinomassiliensis TaxID=1745712 RepID=UPI00093F9D76|nr:hypothetical protein [Anaerococcus urinomassiliensis]
MINEICIKSCTPYDELGVNISNCKKVNFIYGANGSGENSIIVTDTIIKLNQGLKASTKFLNKMILI